MKLLAALNHFVCVPIPGVLVDRQLKRSLGSHIAAWLKVSVVGKMRGMGFSSLQVVGALHCPRPGHAVPFPVVNIATLWTVRYPAGFTVPSVRLVML